LAAPGLARLARNDLERTRQALKAELAEIGGQVRQFRAEVERATGRWNAIALLFNRQALQADRFNETEKTSKVAAAQLSQAESRCSPARPRGR